ncbi:MAG TPA: class I tRNA ligase family protein, partial [Rudaea sp.]|nr:class I tRNA ligase family protein [Rudaea sp.]
KGLAYRKQSVVNWDPVDQTVLANEQVIDGRGWRTGALVEKREIPQWFLKITAYAQELLDGLDKLPGWPESVKTMQRNWIGRSEGLEIQFAVEGEAEPLSVFTTRPDTLMGVTFLSIAAEHPLALRAGRENPQIQKFINECRHGGTAEADIETQEKKGIETGFHAIHPVTGDKLPVWIANFVLMGYGTGAVMGVPGHDERDWEFATKYDLLIRMVIVSDAVRDAIADLGHEAEGNQDPMTAALGEGKPLDVVEAPGALAVVQEFERRIIEEGAYTEYGWLVNSGEYDGLDYRGAFDALAKKFESEGRGARRVNFRLRDWGVSRQRYWGCPIPIVHCAKCGAVAVPEEQLPVLLPENVKFMGVQSPLKADPEWRRTTCPQCGGPAERETDTFDTFMESSWYYARYTSPGATDMIDARANYWLPVDQYIGGIEHAILHLLYFRFYHKLLRDEGLVHSDEPVTNLLCQGMVIADTFYREQSDGNREWINPADVEIMRDEKARITGAVLKSDGLPVEIGAVEKMSKSKNNGVDPQTMVGKYGADTVRLFSMFASPPEMSLEWSENGVAGMARFLRRLWAYCWRVSARAKPLASNLQWNAAQADAETRTCRTQIHELLNQANYDYDRKQFNTVVSAAMKVFNALDALGSDAATVASVSGDAGGRKADGELAARQREFVRREGLSILLRLLGPVTPHVAHELWIALGFGANVLDAGWPKADPEALKKASVTLAVQVNGKLRGTIEVPVDAAREQIERTALANADVAKYVAGAPPKKIIIVPGKIVNIVV